MPLRECRRRSRGQGSSCSCSPPDQDTTSNHAGGVCIADRINSIFTSPDVRQSWTREHPRLFHKPIVSNFPIVVDVLVAGPVRLLPAFPLFDLRGVLELLFGDVQLEAVGLFIVGQHRPGNRIVILADAEEAAETQDRVGRRSTSPMRLPRAAIALVALTAVNAGRLVNLSACSTLTS